MEIPSGGGWIYFGLHAPTTYRKIGSTTTYPASSADAKSIQNERIQMNTSAEDSNLKRTPEEHYRLGLFYLNRVEGGVTSMSDQNSILFAIAEAMLGGLRDGLDYAARQARRELDEEVKRQQEALSRPVAFEEDMDRP